MKRRGIIEVVDPSVEEKEYDHDDIEDLHTTPTKKEKK